MGACSQDEIGFVGVRVQPRRGPYHASACRDSHHIPVGLEKSWYISISLESVLRLPAATLVLQVLQCPYLPAAREWTAGSLFETVSTTNMMTAVYVSKDRTSGATRDWPVRRCAWRLCKHFRRPGPCGVHPCSNLRANLRHGFEAGPRAWCQPSSLFLRSARVRLMRSDL